MRPNDGNHCGPPSGRPSGFFARRRGGRARGCSRVSPAGALAGCVAPACPRRWHPPHEGGCACARNGARGSRGPACRAARRAAERAAGSGRAGGRAAGRLRHARRPRRPGAPRPGADEGPHGLLEQSARRAEQRLRRPGVRLVCRARAGLRLRARRRRRRRDQAHPGGQRRRRLRQPRADAVRARPGHEAAHDLEHLSGQRVQRRIAARERHHAARGPEGAPRRRLQPGERHALQPDGHPALGGAARERRGDGGRRHRQLRAAAGGQGRRHGGHRHRPLGPPSSKASARRT